tara:strand:- start:221 stop:334 length:114 start_codon:yes stop_codon:yes gene_type:complete
MTSFKEKQKQADIAQKILMRDLSGIKLTPREIKKFKF